MAGNNKIPLIVMEEHKEAYYIWHIFSMLHKIPEKDNILLHVDHHPDDIAGTYDFDPDRLPQELEFSKKLSYDLLGIADFIVPAVYERMFTKWIHVSEFNDVCESVRKYIGHKFKVVNGIRKDMLDFVEPFEENKELLRKIDEDYKQNILSNIRPVDYYKGGLGSYAPFTDPVVLDIDLDYFCWSNTLKDGADRILEITKDEWQKLKENTFDAFRIMPVIDFKLFERDGHYFMEFIKIPLYRENDETITLQDLQARVDKFFGWLEERKIVPAAIDICRSRMSGYLNCDFFPWIENEVLRRLDELYGTDIIFRPNQ